MFNLSLVFRLVQCGTMYVAFLSTAYVDNAGAGGGSIVVVVDCLDIPHEESRSSEDEEHHTTDQSNSPHRDFLRH